MDENENSQPQQEDKGFNISLVSFEEGTLKEGFQFHLKQYTSVDVAEKELGPGKILDLINRQVATQMRTKATNRLPKFEEDDDNEKTRAAYSEKREKGDTILITEQEAVNFIPGDRDLSAGTLGKRLQELKKEIMELRAAGEDDSVQVDEFRRTKAKLDALLEADFEV